MKSYNWGTIAVHTINVLFRTINNHTYLTQLNEFEQNIVKWAALFHDLCKRGDPAFEGKDHIHPFNSGALTLKAFREYDII